MEPIKQSSEQTQTPGFCGRCPNFSLCRTIKTQLESCEATAHPSFKKINNLKDHLYRDGYNFPFVQSPSACWLHDKSGVVQYREHCLHSYLEAAASHAATKLSTLASAI